MTLASAAQPMQTKMVLAWSATIKAALTAQSRLGMPRQASGLYLKARENWKHQCAEANQSVTLLGCVHNECPACGARKEQQ